MAKDKTVAARRFMPVLRLTGVSLLSGNVTVRESSAVLARMVAVTVSLLSWADWWRKYG
jgi:hypothetical protein